MEKRPAGFMRHGDFSDAVGYLLLTLVMAQWVRALALQSEGWVFESQPRQTLVVYTGSGSSTAKRSALAVSVTGPRR